MLHCVITFCDGHKLECDVLEDSVNADLARACEAEGGYRFPKDIANVDVQTPPPAYVTEAASTDEPTLIDGDEAAETTPSKKIRKNRS